MLCILQVMGIQVLVMGYFLNVIFSFCNPDFFFLLVGHDRALVRRNSLGKLSNNTTLREENNFIDHGCCISLFCVARTESHSPSDFS